MKLNFLFLLLASMASAADAPGPIIGGAPGQTIRLLVSADGSVRCSARAVFFNSRGEAVESRSFDISPGQAVSGDISVNKLSQRFGQRVDLRPQVTVVAGRCSASVQVLEGFTGRSMGYWRLFTSKAQGDGSVIPAPLAFAAVTVANGQLLRLGVTRGFDPQPEPPRCAVTLSFIDARGNSVGQSKTVDLLPGQFDFVDLNPSSLPALAAGPHVVQPRVLPTGARLSDITGCDGSVQIWESLSGWTSEIVGGR